MIIRTKLTVGNIQLVVLFGLIVSMIAGASLFFWQESNKRKILQQKVDKLNEQLSGVSKEKEELQNQVADLSRAPEFYVKVVSPNGGEKYCLGENTFIRWESKGVKIVRIWLIKGSGKIGLGEYPAASGNTGKAETGEIQWKAGMLISGQSNGISDIYQIEVESPEPGIQSSDKSDNVFSVVDCG